MDPQASHRTENTVPGTGFPVASLVRDALYDRIPLAEPELAIIGTRAFLRLERIQQLGFVSRVWPGARHARFDHSIGVMHLTRQAVAHLRSTPEGVWITDEDARVTVAAALLHDIGHYPFSHAIEELGDPVLPHEVVGAEIVLGSEIAPILREAWGVDPVRVASVIAPKTGEMLHPHDRVLRQVLSGPIDMDKLDYLPRDARACNVPYGGVDTPRLIDALRIAEIPMPGMANHETRVVISDKGISPLHSLVNARQEMFDNVYWHHTNRACMAMLLRAVQEALIAGSITPRQLTGLDDASLMQTLADDAMPDATRRLTEALRDRHIHKRAVEISTRATDLHRRLSELWFAPARRRDVEMRLAASVADLIDQPVPPEAVLIDIPKPEKWRTDVWVRFDRPPVGFAAMMPWREVSGLEDADFKRYEDHRRMIRIVVDERHRGVVQDHWEELLPPALGMAL